MIARLLRFLAALARWPAHIVAVQRAIQRAYAPQRVDLPVVQRPITVVHAPSIPQKAQGYLPTALVAREHGMSVEAVLAELAQVAGRVRRLRGIAGQFPLLRTNVVGTCDRWLSEAESLVEELQSEQRRKTGSVRARASRAAMVPPPAE